MEAAQILYRLLGVRYEMALQQLGKSPNVSLKWLPYEVYKSHCDAEDWEPAARAFMLHLLGSTIFTDKSGSKVKVCYLAMLSDLQAIDIYSWDGVALAYAYDDLRYARQDANEFRLAQH